MRQQGGGAGRSPVRQSVALPPGIARDLLPLTAEDGAAIDAVLYAQRRSAPRTALVLMHPTVSFHHHYAASPLADRGFAVLCCNPRFAGNEANLIMEQVILDLAAGVRHLREDGFERVVLIGNSGGGALAALYQAEAEGATIRSTPAGRPPDLTRALLPAADALVVLNAHRGRAQVLTSWLDPAVVDETDPLAGDPGLDLFAADRRVPYDRGFVAAYRAAQAARNHRITAWVRARLAEAAAAGVADLAFTVHRTAADPRFLDTSLDPSDREPGTYWGPDVRAANYAAAGLGRQTTLHSWLSQWSLEASQAAAEPNLARVSVPLLVVQGTADQGIFPSDVRAVFEAARMEDRQLHWIPEGSHYFLGQPEHQRLVFDLLERWLGERGMGPRR